MRRKKACAIAAWRAMKVCGGEVVAVLKTVAGAFATAGFAHYAKLCQTEGANSKRRPEATFETFRTQTQGFFGNGGEICTVTSRRGDPPQDFGTPLSFAHYAQALQSRQSNSGRLETPRRAVSGTCFERVVEFRDESLRFSRWRRISDRISEVGWEPMFHA